MNYRELSNEQRRQWLDFMQVDTECRACQRELQTRFLGSMRWLRRNAREYLHVKRGRTEKSLGVRSAETEGIYQKFMTEREVAQHRLAALSVRLDQMAPVNRALGLARVPAITARILRKLDEKKLLGSALLVAGTNALWAYEAKAGIQFQSELVATIDADLLWDPRSRLSLIQAAQMPRGILGILEDVDASFKTRGARDYKAINKDGFSVDLIRPEDRRFFMEDRARVSEFAGDLSGAPIFGLHWLLNAPRVTVICIAEDGFSVEIPTFDPRAFVLHKLWMSQRHDRDPLKAARDQAQAKALAEVAVKFLGLAFDATELSALPAGVRGLVR